MDKLSNIIIRAKFGMQYVCEERATHVLLYISPEKKYHYLQYTSDYQCSENTVLIKS